jgi:hypothetical protein
VSDVLNTTTGMQGESTIESYTLTFVATPAPASLALLASGLSSLAMVYLGRVAYQRNLAGKT